MRHFISRDILGSGPQEFNSREIKLHFSHKVSVMIATKFEKKEIRPNSAIFAFAVVVVKTRIVETRLHVKRGTKRVG